MAEANKVVVHFLDGRIVKGTTQDFSPVRPRLHVQPVGGGPAAPIQLNELKALYFVKDFTGAPTRRDIRGFLAGPGETAQGKKIAIVFRDGELLCGYSLVYSADRDGFFLFPADAESNNLRIYVLARAIREVSAGPGAEAFAQRVASAKPRAA